MKRLAAAALLLLASATFVALDRAWPVAGARIPPAGRLLDPFAGVWTVPAASRDAPPARATVAGLRAEVRVVWDDRDVPHVFAADEHDLYVAQGWLVARHPLGAGPAQRLRYSVETGPNRMQEPANAFSARQ